MSVTSVDQAHDMLPSTHPLLSLCKILPLWYPPPSARHDIFSNRCQAEEQYRLQKVQAFYSASVSILSAAELLAALPEIPTQTPLLITGTATRGSDHVPEVITFGACVPTPWGVQRKREDKAGPTCYSGPAHFLFQLELRLEILRSDPEVWMVDLEIDGQNAEEGRKSRATFGNEGETGMVLDFDIGLAALKGAATEEYSADKEKNAESNFYSPYHHLRVDAKYGAKDFTWETSMGIQKLGVYDLGYPISRPIPQTVDEEVLRKRIKGFGSGGSGLRDRVAKSNQHTKH